MSQIMDVAVEEQVELVELAEQNEVRMADVIPLTCMNTLKLKSSEPDYNRPTGPVDLIVAAMMVLGLLREPRKVEGLSAQNMPEAKDTKEFERARKWDKFGSARKRNEEQTLKAKAYARKVLRDAQRWIEQKGGGNMYAVDGSATPYLTDVWKTVVLKKTTRTKGYDSDPEKDTRGTDLDARGQLVTIPAQTRDELEYKRGKRAGVGGVLRQYCPLSEKWTESPWQFSEKLPDDYDNLGAELYAIRAAVCDAVRRGMTDEPGLHAVVVLSDSQEAILEVVTDPDDYEKARPYWSITRDVRWCLQKLDEMEIVYTIVWIPGHVGLKFHDKADKAAKDGAEDGEIPGYGEPASDDDERSDDNHLPLIPYSAACRAIRAALKMEYQRWVKHDKRVTVERYRKRIQRGVWEAPAIELHSTLEKDEDGKTIRVYRRRAVNLALDRAILDCGMDRAMQAHFGGGSPGCPHCSPPMAEATPPGETDAAKSKRHWNARKNGSKHSIRHCIEICPHYKEAREEYGKSLKQAGIFCRQNFMRLTNMLDSDAAPQDKRQAHADALVKFLIDADLVREIIGN